MSGTEQFGAIPVRAFSDTRLSAGDFRVLGVIAYRDRFGRNNAGCYAKPEKLAEMASIKPNHLAWHTTRLVEFGYIEIRPSATDRRKRVYTLKYNDKKDNVGNLGENPAELKREPDDSPQIVTTACEKAAEKVTTGCDKISRQTDVKLLARCSNSESNSTRRDTAKQRLKYPAKQGAQIARNCEPGSPSAPVGGHKPTRAQQVEARQPKAPRQYEIRASGDVDQRNRNSPDRRRAAEQRLTNDICRTPGLYDRLDNKLWPGWHDAYQRAITVEMERLGHGVRYLKGALQRATKEARAA